METFPDISELIEFFFTLVLHLNKRLDSPTAEDLTMMKPKVIVKKVRTGFFYCVKSCGR